jgi:hypothetical protein
LQWLNLLKCATCACETPILFKLGLMKLSPGEHEAELATREIALDRLQGVDPDLGVSIGMLGVKMGEAVIVVVHRDHDAEEGADAGHGSDPLISSLHHAAGELS